jgi:hypothetical protein
MPTLVIDRHKTKNKEYFSKRGKQGITSTTNQSDDNGDFSYCISTTTKQCHGKKKSSHLILEPEERVYGKRERNPKGWTGRPSG